MLVEHYVDRQASQSYVGNVYLGKVQNVLPSMEAAFVDIGKGRNAVLYAGEVNWDAAGMEGQPTPHRVGAEVRPVGAGAGHQGPDRPQGRPPDQPDQPARPLPGVRARRLDDRHQPQAARQGAHPAQGDPEEGHARERRRDRPHGRRGRQRGGAGPRRGPPVGAVGGHPEEGQDRQPRPTLLYGRAGPDRSAWSATSSTRTSPRSSSRASDAWETVDEYVASVAPHLADAAVERGTASRATSSQPTGSTSSSPRRWSARCGCRAAAPW